MSPTSYQTAPPRLSIIATAVGTVKTSERSVLQLMTFASRDKLCRINGLVVYLFFQNLSVFSDQKIHSARSLIFVRVDAILMGDLSAPITEQGEGDGYLVCKRFVCERAIHAHTQDLGVGGFQLFQILL